MKDNGWEFDPSKALARYASNANKKAAIVENLPLINKTEELLRVAFPQNQRFMDQLFTEFKGSSIELADEFATNFWAKVRSFNAGTLLQFATVNNLNQFTFIAQKAGVNHSLYSELF